MRNSLRLANNWFDGQYKFYLTDDIQRTHGGLVVHFPPIAAASRTLEIFYP